jgi:phenylalanyl-tRNA synthetase beta chain
MQDRLINSGIRPINNIVDITNYVMLETNQPLHAFDYNLLQASRTIVVRRARPGETITTLDDVERKLDDQMLLITEGGRGVALAGVMGGQNTEISDETTSVLIESANFLRTSIRRTSSRLGLRSDSSIRFEKGADVNGVIFALNRAAALMQELGQGEIVGGICDEYPEPQVPRQIILRPDRVNSVLGTELQPQQIKEYIQKLKFRLTEENGHLLVYVPTYRPDIEQEADLIEEVARLYGYNNIPATLPQGDTTIGGQNPSQLFRDRVVELMTRNLYEVINFSFISPRWFDMLLLPDNSPWRNAVQIANPLSEEQSVMRTLLLPGLLDLVSRNLARKNSNLAFFEMGKVFYPGEELLPVEEFKLAGIVAGRLDSNWTKNQVEMDYYYLKGLLENLFFDLGIQNIRCTAAQEPGYHPGRCAILQSGMYSWV